MREVVRGDKHNLRKSANRNAQISVIHSAHYTDLCVAICRFSQVCVCHLEQLHAQSPFLFPIVFSINLIAFFDICSVDLLAVFQHGCSGMCYFTCYFYMHFKVRALDRLRVRTRRRVGSSRRRGNHMHGHSRFQRDINDVTDVSLSLSLYLSQKSLTHNIGSASALPIMTVTWWRPCLLGAVQIHFLGLVLCGRMSFVVSLSLLGCRYDACLWFLAACCVFRCSVCLRQCVHLCSYGGYADLHCYRNFTNFRYVKISVVSDHKAFGSV